MTIDPDPERSPLDGIMLEPDAVREALMKFDFMPYYEYAEGQKALLESRGWSQAGAEEAAMTILSGLIGRVFE